MRSNPILTFLPIEIVGGIDIGKLIKILLIICIIFLFWMNLFNILDHNESKYENNLVCKLYIKSSIIEIIGNDGLNNTASSGNGTALNPYIIEGLMINASGQINKDGIKIC